MASTDFKLTAEFKNHSIESAITTQLMFWDALRDP